MLDVLKDTINYTKDEYIPSKKEEYQQNLIDVILEEDKSNEKPDTLL
jgi:hypothetical protein